MYIFRLSLKKGYNNIYVRAVFFVHAYIHKINYYEVFIVYVGKLSFCRLVEHIIYF